MHSAGVVLPRRGCALQALAARSLCSAPPPLHPHLQAVPGPPQTLSCDNTGHFTFAKPATDGGSVILSYDVSVVPQGQSANPATAVTITCPASGCTASDLQLQLTGLTAGSTYEVFCRWVNGQRVRGRKCRDSRLRLQWS